MFSSNFPTGAAYKVLRLPADSVPLDSFAFSPSARFNHRHKGSHFVVLPLGLENLSAALLPTCCGKSCD